jgi:hypothetical protein
MLDLLHRLIDAIYRPADHDQTELHAAVDALAPESPAKAKLPSEPDTPAPVFGTESQPESA